MLSTEPWKLLCNEKDNVTLETMRPSGKPSYLDTWFSINLCLVDNNTTYSHVISPNFLVLAGAFNLLM